MSLKALAIALVAFAMTGNVVAEGDPRACGDFDFIEQTRQRVSATEILADLRSCDVRVVNAIVAGDLIWQSATIKHGLTFMDVRITGTTDFSDTTFEGSTVFFETTFEGPADFQGATFEGDADFLGTTFGGEADFGRATFEGEAVFPDTTFEGRANFVSTTFGGHANFDGTIFDGDADFLGTTFGGDAFFSDTTFEGSAAFQGITFKGSADFFKTTFEGWADFRHTLFSDRLIFSPKINGKIWPPESGIILAAGLSWNQVKSTFPSHGNTIDMHGRWENFFIMSNKASEAAQVRTSLRRFQLRVWVWRVAGSFGIGWLMFIPLYYWRFRKDRRSSPLHHIEKLLLFSLDVISPSIRPWKYDWDTDGGLPVRRVAVITAVESAIGWIVLGLGSALAVAWLTA